MQRFRRIPLLATAIIPHHEFRKLLPPKARKVGSNLRNRADHVIMPVNQSSSFRRFRSANYFPHFRKLPIPRQFTRWPVHAQVAVPATSVDLTLSSRPSRGADANQQKLVTVRSYTENYRQSYSIRTVKDWNTLPQSVVSAGSLALFKIRLSSNSAP